MTTKKIAAVFALTICLCLLSGAFAGFIEECADIRANTLRLHIVANSDGTEDQALKLALRDAMLSEYSGRLAARGAEQARLTASGLLGEMRGSAEAFVRERGYSYPVNVSIVEMSFGTTRYEDFTMPAGRYTALRFEIGEAEGKNWWCVMYPPLCIPAASEGEAKEISERIEALNEPVLYKPAFAVLEVIESISEVVRPRSSIQPKAEITAVAVDAVS